jgi:hypothetical protein
MPVQYGTKRRIPPTTVVNGKVALAYVDDVAIMITNVDKWSDADVIQLLEESASLGKRITAPAAITHFLGETLGGAASQRKMIVEWMKNNNIDPSPRTITLTDSALMRAALTAYSWITKTEIKAFASKDLTAACTWLTRDMDTRPDDVRVAVEGCYKLLKKTV